MSNSRLNAKEIDRQIENDFLEFYNAPYKGEVPDNLIGIFKDALFHAVPQTHQIRVQSIRAILSKKTHELCVGEIGGMTNVILNTPLDWLYPDFETAVERHEAIEKLVITYNKYVADFKSSLEKKKATLLKLIQPGTSTQPPGLRIIGNA